MCQKCNKELSVKNLIEQHLCHVGKCEQCQAMFSDEGDYTKHNKNCETFERIEIMGMIDEEKYKDIQRNTWPDLIKLGAEAIKNQQTKSDTENRTGEVEEVKESGSDKSKETPVQIINTHNT